MIKIKLFSTLLIITIFVWSCRDINDKSAGQTNHTMKIVRFQDLSYIHFDGQKIDGYFPITDVDDNETDLKTIVSKSKIVLRIKEEHCPSCVDFILNQLNKIEDKENAVVLYAHSSRRTIKLKWLNEKLTLPVFIANRDFDVMFKGGEALKPYLFVLGPDMKVSCFHFPDEGNEELMKLYVTSILARILKGNI